jgi:rubrerythrin
MSVLSETPSHIRSEKLDTRDGEEGPFRCGECGYEISNFRSLPQCPMCRQDRWERRRVDRPPGIAI